jgi:hypothetical protein
MEKTNFFLSEMDKILVAYEMNDETNSAEIEVQICNAEDIQTARKELNEFIGYHKDCYIKYKFIESDSLSARIFGEGVSEAVLTDLENTGWEWM